MKQIILLIATSLFFILTCNAEEWFDPSDKNCRQYGGSFSAKGVCKASWANAKHICNASGGNTPTIDKLKDVVKKCGGKVNAKDNVDNDSYVECFEEKGFSWLNSYWASSEYDKEDAWSLFFTDGSADFFSKKNEYYVRCIK